MGKVLSEETKKKMSIRMKGKVWTRDEVERRRNTRCNKWIYEITTPSGIIEKTNNMAEYCRNNNRNNRHMSEVANGIWKQHKGYQVKKYEISTLLLPLLSVSD